MVLAIEIIFLTVRSSMKVLKLSLQLEDQLQLYKPLHVINLETVI